MTGGVGIVVVLLLFPVAFLMGMTAIAAALGVSLKKDAEARYEGSELLDLNI
jgi:hypothetical protein